MFVVVWFAAGRVRESLTVTCVFGMSCSQQLAASVVAQHRLLYERLFSVVFSLSVMHVCPLNPRWLTHQSVLITGGSVCYCVFIGKVVINLS